MKGCEEILDAIEAIAAGDAEPAPAVAGHLASCGNCRAALAQAREIERLLQARVAPAAPPQFTARVLARVRRDLWRRDQLLDAGFNTAVLVLVISVVVAIWLALNQTGIVTFSRDTFDLTEMAIASVVRRIAPELPLYAAATALIAAAVGVWSWVERDLTP